MSRSSKLLAGVLVKELAWYLWLLSTKRGYLRICNRGERLISNDDSDGYLRGWQWTSDLHAPKQISMLGRLIVRRAIADHPIGRASDPAQVTKAPCISFIVGHRGTSRLPHLLATLQSIAAQRDAAVECIVVEQDAVPQVAPHLPAWVRLVHTPPPAADMPYCRSWAFNVGVKHARANVLVLHDNDLLVPVDYASQILSRVAQGYDLVNLKRFIFYLSQDHTEAVFGSDAKIIEQPPQAIVQNTQGGGSIAITRAGFERIGGMNEAFVGWGGEDNEFWERAQTLPTWDWSNLSLVHLWHPPQLGKHDTFSPTALSYKALSLVQPEERIRRLVATPSGDKHGPAGWGFSP